MQAEEVLPEGVGLAAVDGDVQAVTAWLDEGGGVNVHCPERCSMTLLMVATAAGQEALVRMLLQRGASVDLQDSDGFTALMRAAQSLAARRC